MRKVCTYLLLNFFRKLIHAVYSLEAPRCSEHCCFHDTLEVDNIPPTPLTHTLLHMKSQGLELRSYQLIIKNTKRP